MFLALQPPGRTDPISQPTGEEEVGKEEGVETMVEVEDQELELQKEKENMDLTSQPVGRPSTLSQQMEHTTVNTIPEHNPVISVNTWLREDQ